MSSGGTLEAFSGAQVTSTVLKAGAEFDITAGYVVNGIT